jgi:peptidoglycan/LPS O-acetylase OafA/YrhL
MIHDPRQSKTYTTLQILYTFLAALLMVYHATQHYNIVDKELFGNFFTFGELGEDLLFVLMGFTVFYTSWRFIEEQRGYRTYMVYTLTRIFLVYWVLIAIPGFIVWNINPNLHASIAEIKADEWWQVFTMWFGHPRIAVITWVLTQLVFFALLFGLAILNRKFIYLWGIVLAVSFYNLIDRLFIGAQPFGDVTDPWFKVFSPHNLEFAFGGLIFFLYKKGYFVRRYRLFLLFAVAVVFGIGAIHSMLGYDLYGPRVVTFGLAAALLTYAVVNYAQFIEKAPDNIFVKLGEAEYIMLLIHGPILSIMDFHFATKYSFGWIVTLATIFMILTVSYFIRRKIEAPALAVIYNRFMR